jgi:putative endonuclease
MASDKNGTLYTGVTSDLIRRVYEHKTNQVKGFTKQYNVHKLVYYESVDDMYAAISREKQIKNWQRKWKLELIESVNPEWRDLYDDII